ncbi:hypothetical protein [Rhodoglobus vestalii]|nr:hypothetical protein [Rhodoglobus vestalii]
MLRLLFIEGDTLDIQSFDARKGVHVPDGSHAVRATSHGLLGDALLGFVR